MSQVKKCAITGCSNMENETNKKYFYTAPRSLGIRGLWMMAAGKVYSQSTKFYVCEDHFDVSIKYKCKTSKLCVKYLRFSYIFFQLTKDVDYIHHITGKPVLLKFTSPTLKLEGNTTQSKTRSVEGSSSRQAEVVEPNNACQAQGAIVQSIWWAKYIESFKNCVLCHCVFACPCYLFVR